MNKPDFWSSSPLQRVVFSGNTHAFRHTCFRHFVQRSYGDMASGNLTIVSHAASVNPEQLFYPVHRRFRYRATVVIRCPISPRITPGHSISHCTVMVCIFTGPMQPAPFRGGISALIFLRRSSS